VEAAARAVGVLGAGTIGAGITRLTSQVGYRVIACDRSVAALEKAQLYVRDGLARFARKGVISESDARSAYECVRWTVNAEELTLLRPAARTENDGSGR
jgi:3-hydroxybutyryl-CoA dehydrogenase